MNIGRIGHGKMSAQLKEAAQVRGAVSFQVEKESFHQKRGQKNPDVLIDFSHPDKLTDVLNYSQSLQVPLVIGTTGYTKQQMERIYALGSELPVLYSANFSLGVFVLNQLVTEAATVLNDWEIEVIEKHHAGKKDAPSGTAHHLIGSIRSVREETTVAYGRTGPRKAQEIGVHSVRAGSFPGEHEVLFAAPNEVLSIKHEAFSSRIFADGAIKAAEWLMTQANGFYTLENMLKKKE